MSQNPKEMKNSRIKSFDIESNKGFGSNQGFGNMLKGGRDREVRKYGRCLPIFCIILILICFILYWIFATTEILPAMRKSIGSNPNDWALAFFIILSVIITVGCLNNIFECCERYGYN